MMEEVREICVDCQRYWEQVRTDEDEPLCWKCYYQRQGRLDIYYLRLRELDNKLKGLSDGQADNL